MGDEKKREVEIKDNEYVTIPYSLFNKMLEEQNKITKRFCKTIIITTAILMLPIVIWAIGYFLLYNWKGDRMSKIIEAIKKAFYFALDKITRNRKENK